MMRRTPPVWLMGFANLTFGFAGGITLVTVPQLLAAEHVAEPRIAAITALAMIPTFASFVLTPILDVRFSRRSYAIALTLLAGLLTAAGLARIADVRAVTILFFAQQFAAQLTQSAVGGWLGAALPAEKKDRLGAWYAVGSFAGFGSAAAVTIKLVRALPGGWGAAAAGLLVASPVLILVFMPPPSADRREARESFATLFRDLAALVRRPAVVRTLAMFCLPAASFALTNTLGGLGSDFGASEAFVGAVAGLGVTIAGVVGSLIAPRFAGRGTPLALYLAIGVLGAAFTLSLTLMPRTPLGFAVALIGENVFQSAAFAVQFAIVFRGIGRDNPLAATQFGLLIAAQSLPIDYMQAIDGQAYGAGALNGTLACDALLSLAACAALAPFVLRWRRTGALAANT